MNQPIVMLGDVAVIVAGQSPKGSDIFESPARYPFHQGVRDFGRIYPTDRTYVDNPPRLAEAGDVLLSVRAPIGRVNKAQKITAIGRGLMALRGGERLDTDYLFYLLASLASQWGRYESGGSVFSNLGKAELAKVPIALPSITEQRRISALLDVIDDKIESNQRVITAALEVARGHVDNVSQGRPLVTYSSFLEVTMGAAFKGDYFSEPGRGRPLLRIRDLKTFTSQVWTVEERKDETIIHPGDLVVGMDAEFRATLWLGNDSVLNQRVCSFRGKAGVCRAFVLAALESELSFQERAKTGTTVIHLNKADIDTFVVPELSTNEHRELFETTEPLIELVVARAKEVQTLSAIRETLLSELLSGRVSIPETGEELLESTA